MRWLIVNTDYPAFLRWLYDQHPGLERASYAAQWQTRVDSLFGVADFYSTHLQALGHEAWDVIANCAPLQRQWAREQGVRCGPDARWTLRGRRDGLPWPVRTPCRQWIADILEVQLAAYRPDVFYCMALEAFGSEFVRRAKRYCRFAVAQHAAMVPPVDFRAYDLILSSLPNLVDHFRAHGLRSEYFRLAFEPRVLAHLNGTLPTQDVVFVGGLSGIQHEDGARLLETICERCDVRVAGYGAERLPPQSRVRQRAGEPLWGHEMYRALRSAKIVLNRHGPIALRFANNMRLFEATGVGSLLLTDQKDNLAELFAPGREVATYANADECLAQISYYLTHDTQREAVAAAGQARTLREHTWAHRMRELVEIVGRHL